MYELTRNEVIFSGMCQLGVSYSIAVCEIVVNYNLVVEIMTDFNRMTVAINVIVHLDKIPR